MRWLVLLLFLFNAVFLLWNVIFFKYAKRSVDGQAIVAADVLPAMPGGRLVLLRDVTLSNAGGVGMSDGLDPRGDALKEGDNCLIVGPYQDPLNAKVMIARLGALGVASRFSTVEMSGDIDYWVYLSPLPNREMALLKLRELQEKKIDSFIIPEGEMANGISLGVFDDQEGADKQRSLLEGIGYSANIKTNSRSYLENWVVIYPGDADKFSQELGARIKTENPLVDIRKEECSKVASTIDIH